MFPLKIIVKVVSKISSREWFLLLSVVSMIMSVTVFFTSSFFKAAVYCIAHNKNVSTEL